MKKSIVTVLALCTAALAYGDTTTTYTTETPQSSGQYGNTYGWTLVWGETSPLNTAVGDTSTTIPTTSTLTQVTVTTAGSGSSSNTPYLAVYDSSYNLLGVSDNSVTYSNDSDSVFDFSTAITLTTGERYYFVYVESENAAALSLANTTAVQYRSGFNTSATSSGSYGRVYTSASTVSNTTAFNTGRLVAATYVTTVTTADSTAAVPEPATATLSLLALAGLAARRRRK